MVFHRSDRCGCFRVGGISQHNISAANQHRDVRDANLEVIQWLRRWDEGSEAELGIPDNADREMMTDRMRRELPAG